MNYKEAMAYIKSLRRFGSRPGLERIGELCRRLGDPQNDFRYIHVTGTNGKGSVCSMIYSALCFAGVGTGLFTSPYMLDFSERFAADGTYITREEIASIVTEIAPHADAMEDTPTEFELLTAMAFLFFRARCCKFVVFEAGMGGRLDSTNIIPTPEVAVITGVALDHTAILGPTVEAIAREKAGIIKRGCSVVIGDMPAEAESVIRDAAAAVGAEVTHAGAGTAYEPRDVEYSSDGVVFTLDGRGDFFLPLCGIYQPKNAAVAVAALDRTQLCGRAIPDIVIKEGLSRARWRGRFELFSPDPVLIFDGAHNPQGMRAAADSLAAYYPSKKFCVVTGVLADKDYAEIASIMREFALEAHTITPQNTRALSASDYAEVLSGAGIPATPHGSMAEALAACAGRDTIVVGSLYIYKDFIEATE